MNMPSGFDFSQDILPLGDYEAIPVSSILEPIPENYPEVVRLGKQTNIEQLRKEWDEFEKSGDYFASRMRHFKNSFRETVKLFDHLGFSRSKYKAYPLRKQGTNILQDTVGPYTRSLLENFEVDLFRQQYVLATAGWSTKLHIDHPDFRMHGFRVFIPIDDAFIGFKENVYHMPAGDCYFVNIAKMHRGFSDKERVVIMCQMASDKLVIPGAETLLPIDQSLLSEEYRCNAFIE
jgi:hypothetical protein